MQYKNAPIKNITARGKLQIICKLKSCKFLMAAQAANFHYIGKLHFLTSARELQILNMRKSCNPEL